jgi:hypothetical protein
MIFLKNASRLAGMLLPAFMAITFFTACTYKKNGNNKPKTKTMKTILIIGMNPRTIDFTNPELPAGLTAEMVEKGTKATLEQLAAAGYQAEAFLIDTGTTDLSSLGRRLKDQNYDGVVVGNGIRGLSANFLLFEQIINAVHANAPGARIIFNTLPTNTVEAVQRWL